MRFDGFNTIEGRHLVLAYAAVMLIQGSYLAWIITQWGKLRSADKKTTKPV